MFYLYCFALLWHSCIIAFWIFRLCARYEVISNLKARTEVELVDGIHSAYAQIRDSLFESRLAKNLLLLNRKMTFSSDCEKEGW